jgi:glutathione reductase (NADPH)
MKQKFEAIIIGGGVAGINAALKFREKDMTVAVFEENYFGINEEIIFDRIAEDFSILKNASELANEIVGEIDPQLILNLKEFEIQKQRISEKNEAELNDFGIAIYHTYPRFKSKNIVEINAEEIQFKYCLISPEHRQLKHKFSGAEYIFSYSKLLELERFPRSVIIIDELVNSLKMAEICLVLGISPIVLCGKDDHLVDSNFSDVEFFLSSISEKGIDVRFNQNIDEIEKHDENFYLHNSNGETIITDMVIGNPNSTYFLDKLDLEEAQIEYSANGIEVNQFLQTNHKNTYAVAGAVSNNLYQPASYTLQGAIAVSNCMENSKKTFSNTNIPIVGKSNPDFFIVGLDKKQSAKEGINADEISIKIELKEKILSANQNKVTLNVVFDKDTFVILGVFYYGENAEDLADVFSLMLTHKATINEISQYPFRNNSILQSLVAEIKKRG